MPTIEQPASAIARGPIRSAIGPDTAPTTKSRLTAIDKTQESAPREAPKLPCSGAKKAEKL